MGHARPATRWTRWVEAMFDLAERNADVVAPAPRAQALLFGGIFARIRGERAADYVGESLRLGRGLERPGDRGHVIGRALIQLGLTLSERGDFEAAMAVFRDALCSKP